MFSRAWTFVAHESEIPHNGDYVVRRVLDDSFIITRDSQGDVRAMFNMCLHRGMQVCRAEMGNASNFRCPYHGWTYRNDGRLTGLPFHREAYDGDKVFAKDSQNLLPAPNFASYNGLLFISMDARAEPLEEYLGDFRFYLHFYTKQSTGGLELRGPQRWRIKANWKIGAENFAGDMYHSPHTHASIVDTDLPHTEPCIEIRELKIWATETREGPTGLRFHTIEEANTALEAIAATQAIRSMCGPDLASVIPGANIVAVDWTMHAAVYRLDRIHPASHSRAARPAVLAG